MVAALEPVDYFLSLVFPFQILLFSYHFFKKQELLFTLNSDLYGQELGWAFQLVNFFSWAILFWGEPLVEVWLARLLFLYLMGLIPFF